MQNRSSSGDDSFTSICSEMKPKSNNNKYVGLIKRNAPQVYSSYIENQRNSTINDDDQIKKPKFTNASNHQQENSEIKSEDYDDFIGINTFDNVPNIFVDLADKYNIILVCLDRKCNFSSIEESNELEHAQKDGDKKKNKFCFKGRSSLRLIFGALSINGYSFSNYSITTHSHKWLDLYSPESNSFLTIKNVNNQKLDSLNSNDIEMLLSYTLTSVGINDISSIDNRLVNNLRNYMSLSFQAKNANPSLFALKGIKPKLCSYIGYFDNFKHVYENKSLQHINQLNTSGLVDSKLSKLGIYPVSAEFLNTVHVETKDEKEVLKQILEKENKNNNEPTPTIMACGGKDVGKSTFLRYVVNSLLSKYKKVAYLDCDPGQCEFTLGGCISLTYITEPLLGPPHTHVSHSDKNRMVYFLGHLSPNDVPSHYMECLKRCNNDYQSQKQPDTVLLVNTMGWNQGLGLCLLKETVLLFKPTHIIQINHPIEANKNMPVLNREWLVSSDGYPSSRYRKLNNSSQQASSVTKLNTSDDGMQVDDSDQQLQQFNELYKDINYKLLELKSSAPHKTVQYQKQTPQKRFSARDHRNLAILAYFSELQDKETKNLNYTPIHHIRPYKILWSKLALHVSHMRVDFKELFRVFNASLVGLCQIDNKYIKKRDENQQLPGYLNFYDSEMPVAYRCFGFGIIRGINMETKEFYILTPEPQNVLSQVNLLVKGMLNIPLELFYEQDTQTQTPYMSISNTIQSYPNKPSKNSVPISNEPLNRKYLIHQSQNNNQRNQEVLRPKQNS